MTRATQSLTETMDGSREQLCGRPDIKTDIRESLARSRARSLQKPRLDDRYSILFYDFELLLFRWLLEPGDMSRSLSASYRLPSPNRRLLTRPQVCRTAEEIHAERSTMWLSKLRSEIESFVEGESSILFLSDSLFQIKADSLLKMAPSRRLLLKKLLKRRAKGNGENGTSSEGFFHCLWRS